MRTLSILVVLACSVGCLDRPPNLEPGDHVLAVSTLETADGVSRDEAIAIAWAVLRHMQLDNGRLESVHRGQGVWVFDVSTGKAEWSRVDLRVDRESGDVWFGGEWCIPSELVPRLESLPPRECFVITGGQEAV